MASVKIPVKLTPELCIVGVLVLVVIAFYIGRMTSDGSRNFVREGFSGWTQSRSGAMNGSEGFAVSPLCSLCQKPASSCGCTAKGVARLVCPPCREPDLSKYVLKSSIPPCPALPDLSQYMLKTECPPVPDLSKYVLKSSIPKQQPVIIDNSACKKDAGECPPCPRPRCPEIKCPAPTVCPPPAPCPRPVCPPQTVKCKAEESTASTVRPFLAPLNFATFGGS